LTSSTSCNSSRTPFPVSVCLGGFESVQVSTPPCCSRERPLPPAAPFAGARARVRCTSGDARGHFG
jgi:hypothetical protein